MDYFEVSTNNTCNTVDELVKQKKLRSTRLLVDNVDMTKNTIEIVLQMFRNDTLSIILKRD